MNGKTLVFIPAYNCEKQILRVLDRLRLANLEATGEILVVDNQSSDNTVKSVLAWLQSNAPHSRWKFRLFRNSNNYSLGGSHKVAFQHCLGGGFDQCVVLHGDDQADISDLEKVFHYQEDFDCLLGARFAPGSKLDAYSRFRTVGNITLNFLFSLLSNTKVFDLGSGLNIYSRRYLEKQAYLSFRNDLTFNVYLLIHALLSNAKIHFFPIHWSETDQISNAKVMRQGWHSLWILGRAFLRPADFLAPKPNEYSSLSYSYDELYP